MSIWKNVLVYADGRPESEVALAEGIRLSSHAAGQATAMDVLHHLPTRIPAGLLAMAEKELHNLMVEQRTEQLEDDVARLRMAEPVLVRVTHGNPAFELIRHANNTRQDLIVKAARGRDVRHMTSFGTTALHLVRKSPVPVLMMSPEHRRLQQRPKVLCAIDWADDDERLDLNRRLLASASALAEVYEAELMVVHVLDTARTSVYRAFLGADALAQLVRGWHGAVQKNLEDLLTRELPGTSNVRVHLLEGDAGVVIPRMVTTEQISHLVLGSVGHREPGLLIGSLAEDLLSQVQCSVLTLKPRGFQTPIDSERAA